MFFTALQNAFDLNIILLTAFGSLSGVLIGALPGLSVTMATALLVSLTFSWPVEYALAMIIGVYTGGVFGGSISAVILNIPGAPSAICTGFDGYPLARQGEASMALGLWTLLRRPPPQGYLARSPRGGGQPCGSPSNVCRAGTVRAHLIPEIL